MNNWNKIKQKSLGEIPQEASQNLQAPETAPYDKRITGRTKQLNLKVKEKTYWKLKELALKNKCLMTEILEKALALYQKQKKQNRCPQCLKKGSEMDSYEECGKDFCLECLTGYGELVFCKNCENE